MRLGEEPTLPMGASSKYEIDLNFTLKKLFKDIARKVNQIGDGRIAGSDFTAASIPTTGTFKQGDFIRNSAPVELGTAGSKYIVQGWTCTVGGSPGTLLPVRTLTGN